MDTRPSLIPAQPELWDLWVWTLRRHFANIMLIATCLSVLNDFRMLWERRRFGILFSIMKPSSPGYILSYAAGQGEEQSLVSLLPPNQPRGPPGPLLLLTSSPQFSAVSFCLWLHWFEYVLHVCVECHEEKCLDSFRTLPLALFALEFHWGILVPLESQRITMVLAQITCWSARGRCCSFPTMPPWGGDKGNQGTPTQINNISQTIICVTPLNWITLNQKRHDANVLHIL